MEMNSFAMIFGRCVWIPPSPKAALAALSLFYGIGVSGEPDITALQTIISDQYVSTGKSQSEADKESYRRKLVTAIIGRVAYRGGA
jgi:hypothetical protein